MSIIYDALKKIEKSNVKSLKAGTDKNPKPKNKTYLLYALVVFIGFFLAYVFFGLLPKPPRLNTNIEVKKQAQINNLQALSLKQGIPEAPPPPTTASAVTPPLSVETAREFGTNFVLNGVFFSEEGGYALVNNQIVKEGDKIDGATVKRITLDSVELEFQGRPLTLSR